MAQGVSPAELEALYAQLAPAVFRRARRLLGRDADAWDAVQEVFVQLLRAGPKFRGEARPMTWVWRITTNICLNQLRARRVREAHLEAVEEGTNTIAATETRQLLKKWMAELDERELAVATLLYLDGLTQDETADVLQLSRKTIGREVEVLRAKLDKLGALPKVPAEVAS
jgi:RNA polymerase sigma-70 factor (ECF subfamily)